MSKKNTCYIKIKNKYYPFTIELVDQQVTIFTCDMAGIPRQEFATEDVPQLIIDLPELIQEEQDFRSKQNDMVRFRISGQEKSEMEKLAVKKGYRTLSAFLRDLVKRAKEEV